MSRQLQLYHWADTLASRPPVLPKSQAFDLALYSFGMILAHGCGLSAVAMALAPLLGRPDNTPRQRLREFFKPRGNNKAAAANWMSPPASPRCWPGSCPCGPAGGWCWPWT